MRRSTARAEHLDLVGGPDHRDGRLLQQPVHEHAGGGDWAILTKGVADEDVLSLVEQQYGFTGGGQLLRQLQAVQPFVPVGLATSGILFGHRAQPGADAVRQGGGEGGLPGSGWAVEQDVDARLPPRDGGGQHGGGYLGHAPEMGERLPGQDCRKRVA